MGRFRRLGPLRYSDLGRRLLAPPEQPNDAGGQGSQLTGWLARSLDRWWADQGRPDPFTLVVVSGDDGRLARAVLDARPACAPALRYVLVDPDHGDPAVPPDAVTARLALEQPAFLYPAAASGVDAEDADGDGSERPPATGIGPLCTFLPTPPALGGGAGAVVAIEMLSRLAYDVYVTDARGTWYEVRLAMDEAAWAEVTVALDAPPAGMVGGAGAAGGIGAAGGVGLTGGAGAGRGVRWSGAIEWTRDVLATGPAVTVAVVESSQVARAGLFAQLSGLRPPSRSGTVAAPGDALSVLEWWPGHVG